MRCEDNTLFVFTQYNEHHFMVVSDEGESVAFLKRQLQLIHELLQFHFGQKAENKAVLSYIPHVPLVCCDFSFISLFPCLCYLL